MVRAPLVRRWHCCAVGSLRDPPGDGHHREVRRLKGRRSESEVVYGANPVFELLQVRIREVERVLVARERRAGVGRILRLAREAGIPVSHLARPVLERMVGRNAAHQGIAAVVSPVAYADAATI